MDGAHRNMRIYSSGFTLTEVLVALVILGGGMAVLINAYYSGLHLHVTTQELVDERMLLESVVGRAEMGISGEALSGDGDFGPRYPEYRWSYEAEERGESGSPFLLDTKFFSVTATLHVPGGASRNLSFYTFSNREIQSAHVGP